MDTQQLFKIMASFPSESERQANRAKAAHAEPGAEEAATCTQGPRLAWESVSESQVVAGMIVSIVQSSIYCRY
jgi:hypothetical protein